MTKRALAILGGAIVVVAVLAVVLAFSLTGGDSLTHTMSDGSTMQGQMHTMSDGSSMSNDQMHTMSDGTSMPNDQMGTGTVDTNAMHTTTDGTHTMSNGSSMHDSMMGN